MYTYSNYCSEKDGLHFLSLLGTTVVSAKLQPRPETAAFPLVVPGCMLYCIFSFRNYIQNTE